MIEIKFNIKKTMRLLNYLKWIFWILRNIRVLRGLSKLLLAKQWTVTLKIAAVRQVCSNNYAMWILDPFAAFHCNHLQISHLWVFWNLWLPLMLECGTKQNDDGIFYHSNTQRKYLLNEPFVIYSYADTASVYTKGMLMRGFVFVIYKLLFDIYY